MQKTIKATTVLQQKPPLHHFKSDPAQTNTPDTVPNSPAYGSDSPAYGSDSPAYGSDSSSKPQSPILFSHRQTKEQSNISSPYPILPPPVTDNTTNSVGPAASTPKQTSQSGGSFMRLTKSNEKETIFPTPDKSETVTIEDHYNHLNGIINITLNLSNGQTMSICNCGATAVETTPKGILKEVDWGCEGLFTPEEGIEPVDFKPKKQSFDVNKVISKLKKHAEKRRHSI
jgi:hypothetical protein